jgi:hypothetical protein
MSRFLGLLASSLALALVLGTTACKKDAEKAQEEAAEKAGATAEKAVEKTEEAAEEKQEAAKANEEAKEAHAQAGAAAAATGIEACDQLMDIYAKCDKIPQQSRDAFLQGAEQWKKAIETGGDAAKTQIENSCKQTLESSKESFKQMGC